MRTFPVTNRKGKPQFLQKFHEIVHSKCFEEKKMRRSFSLLRLSTNDTSAGHKKRHHKKSKKVRKHKSKRKDSSDSDSDSSNSSDDSSDAEVVKRKKQKKQKKSKRRHRHETKGSSAADDSDAHNAKNAKEAQQKTHYSIDDDDERQRQKKNKRIDEMKKLRGTDPAFDEKGIKSKWDSPTGDDYDTKR